jgi:hypothetical protein
MAAVQLATVQDVFFVVFLGVLFFDRFDLSLGGFFVERLDFATDLLGEGDFREVVLASCFGERRGDWRRLLVLRFSSAGSAIGRSISQGAVIDTTWSPSFSSWITFPLAVRP